MLKVTGKHLYWSLFFNEATRSETTNRKAWKLCSFCINEFSQKARWRRDETRFAMVERNCVILSGYSFTRRELSLTWIIQQCYNFLMQWGLYPPANLFMACKERYNLCMNRASLDRISLGRVSSTSTTLYKHSCDDGLKGF